MAHAEQESVVAIALLREDGAVLMQLRDQKPGLRHAGQWGLPGGHREPGETLEECGRREFREETGYACGRLHQLTSFEHYEGEGWPPYQLTVFWEEYDGSQSLRCGEGQALQFIERESAADYAVADYLLRLWDMALAAQRAAQDASSAMRVPYTAFEPQARALMPELLAAAERVLASGQYVLGPEGSAFEREFAAYCGTRYAVGVASGTDALHLTLRALGIGAGDEVITASNSFIASASSIMLAGARPVFADIGADLNLDPRAVEAAITPRTKALLPVHLTGRPAPMDALLDIAARRGLLVIEDAAQAVGARLHGRRVGAFGRAACFSFHPLKNLHAFGDGGAITTNDGALAERLVQARNHGLRDRNTCEWWSVNSRLDELQAALLRVQLRHLDAWTESRRRLAARYHERLGPHVEVPKEAPGEWCVYQTYMVQADDRDRLCDALNARGVEARVHYPVPIHAQPAAAALGGRAEDLPMTVRAARRVLSLPLYPELTHAQQDRVAELIREFYVRTPYAVAATGE